MKYGKDKKKKSYFKYINNTFSREHLSDPYRKIEIEVGDNKQSSFYPQFKTKHWDNEVNFSVRLKSKGSAKEIHSEKNGTIEWKKGGCKTRFYTQNNIDEGGAFEFEVELSKKPKSNVIEFTTKSKGLDFYYQPHELDKDENDILQSPERAEKVKGSYAVYHKEKTGDYSKVGGKNYLSGKAFHIYRPFVTDSKGKKVWCELHIDEKKELLTITIPKDFLDSAIYPIIIDPTFGYTTTGSSTGYGNNNFLFGSTFANSVDGTGVSITYIYAVTLGTNPSQTSYAILYGADKKLVGYTYEKVDTVNGITTVTSNFESNTSLSSQSYFICYTSKVGTASGLLYDVGATNQGPYYDISSYGQPPPSDISSYTTYYTNRKHSIYVTYDTNLGVNVNDSIISKPVIADIIKGSTRSISVVDSSLLQDNIIIPKYDTTYGTSYTQGPNNDKLLTLNYGGWGDNYYSFIYFDIDGYPSDVSGVYLRIYNNTNTVNDAQNTLYRVTEDWYAPRISSTNNPTYDTTPIDYFASSTLSGWQVVSITALYKNWTNGIYPNHGLTIRSSSSNETSGNFSSMEGINSPQLFIYKNNTVGIIDAIRDNTRDIYKNDSVSSSTVITDIIRGDTRDVSSSDIVTSSESLNFSPIRISVSSSLTVNEKLRITQPISYSLFDVYDTSQTPVNNWAFIEKSSGRDIVKDSIGNLYVTYIGYNSTISQYTIRLSRSTDGGQIWSQKEIATNASYLLSYPRIAIDSNDILTISFEGYGVINTTISNIQTAHGTWSGGFTINTITDLSTAQYSYVLAVDSNDNVHVIFSGIDSTVSNPTVRQIRYVKISSTGVVGTIQTLTDEPSRQYYPVVAIDLNNVIHVSWYGVYTGGNSHYQVMYIANISGVWGSIQRVSSNSETGDIKTPSIALDSLNKPRIVAYNSATYGVVYYEYTTSWQPPVTIMLLGYQQYNSDAPASIALDTQDTEHIAFQGGNPLASAITPTVIYYTRKSKGGVWKNNTTINDYTFNNPIYQKYQNNPNLLYSTFPIIKGVPTNKVGIGAIGVWLDTQSTTPSSVNNILGFKTQDYIGLVTLSVSTSDSLSITENLSRRDILSVDVFESVVITENIVSIVPFYNVNNNSLVVITENIVSATSADNINTSDSITLTERVDAIRDNSRNLSVDENISITSYVSNERTDRGIQVFLDNIKITNIIDRSSLTVENIMTSQVDICNFTTRKFGNTTFTPKVGNEISVYNNGVKIFGGIAVRVTQRADDYKIILYDVECEDYTRFLDKKLVADIFTNKTIGYIIDFITNKYLSGFTTNNVTGVNRVIAYIAFNYVTVSDCLKQLSKLTDYDWYVDYGKDIHFFSKTDKIAPFEVIDTGGSYIFNSMRIRTDTTQLRNKIYIRGGQYLADTFTSQFVSNGIQNVYPLGYTYNDIQVSVTGTVWDGGIDGIDAITPYDYLWNTKQKFIRFRGDRVPNNLSNIRISGQPYLPVRVVLQDEASIASMVSSEGGGDGVYEHLIIDKSINSRAGARERASAELVSYKNTLSEGQFTTYNDGLQSGQRIHINSVAYGIDEYFIINKVTARMWTEKKLVYDVSLVTTKTMGVIEFLQGLVMKQTTQIVINKDEVVDLVYAKNETATLVESSVASTSHNPVSESSTLVETVTEQALNYPVTFVAGPYTPTTTKRVFVLDGSPLG